MLIRMQGYVFLYVVVNVLRRMSSNDVMMKMSKTKSVHAIHGVE